ncbi:hypothetical protein GCM10025768_03410 [Microbacterium pseudoresistens]|uniref:Sugar (Pentulose or hexulose) kinase n=1 Tax=Microbacterium pseudoresistens TaxID=640634 RepID=A0A7Y9EUG0_9MICO|nr:FGGY family carbohydrate kinase [Microbacterium pseudoresistens]NYD54177.1 sugar (pentulose or hexulose) kinase [Microbacterium pseudoresistens]
MWFLGIDVGTTHIKVVGITAEGLVLDPLRVRTPASVTNGETYHHGDAVWTHVQELVMEYAATLAAYSGALAAISIGTFGQEESFPVDEHGAPLAGSRAWWETWPRRVLVPQDVAWLDSPQHYSVSGMRFRDNQTPERIAQLRTQDAPVWARTAHWVDFGSFLGFCLSGEWAASTTQVTHSQLFDLATLKPHQPTLDRLGLASSLIVPVAHPGTRLGAIRADRLPGVELADDAAVYVGGHDQVLAAYANAMLTNCTVLDSIGTAEYVMITGTSTLPNEELWALCADVEPGWLEGQNVLGWGLPTGKILQQLADQLLDGDFDRLLAAINPDTGGTNAGADTVEFTVTDLRQINDELFTITGARAEDAPEQIVRSCVSQLSQRIGDTLALLAGRTLPNIDSVTLTGSLFQRAELVQHREQMWGIALHVSELGEAVAIGAAHLARSAHENSSAR